MYFFFNWKEVSNYAMPLYKENFTVLYPKLYWHVERNGFVDM